MSGGQYAQSVPSFGEGEIKVKASRGLIGLQNLLRDFLN
jgi:hypothetical protein